MGSASDDLSAIPEVHGPSAKTLRARVVCRQATGQGMGRLRKYLDKRGGSSGC